MEQNQCPHRTKAPIIHPINNINENEIVMKDPTKDSSDNPKIQFECVLPIEDHAKLIMNWRNDPQTLAMSYHSTPKTWPSFFAEFLSDYFSFPDLPPLFASINGQPIAFLRFKRVPHPENVSLRCSDISINVSPEWRHKGLGVKILQLAKSWIHQQGYNDLYAEVKENNTISQKAFLQAGFRQLSNAHKSIFNTNELIPILRFLSSTTPQNTLPQSHVFIIAEAGSNWRMGTPSSDLKMAKTLIKFAAEAGADAIKFQVFRPETVYVPNAGSSDYLAEAGIKEDIREIFSDLSMPYEMITLLAKECRDHHIQFMASPFSPKDFAAVDPFVNIHKIASFEIGHVRLLELAAQSKKPILLSTGAATEDEIAWSFNFLNSHQSGPITLLQCSASYPAPPSSMHLKSIPWLRERFKVPSGLSDHSRDPLNAPIAAVALGASVIEKHFTIDNNLPGPDHAFAITHQELKMMVHAIRQTEVMLGSPAKMVDPSEIELRNYARRGIQATSNIKKGDLLKEDVNIAILRPGKQSLGVHPKFLNDINGKLSKHNIPIGKGLQLGDW